MISEIAKKETQHQSHFTNLNEDMTVIQLQESQETMWVGLSINLVETKISAQILDWQ